MNINTYAQDDVVVLEPEGKIMLTRDVRELDEKLDGLLAKGQKKVVLDLHKTAWIGSAAISTFLDHHERFKEIGGYLKLANLAEEVQKIIGVTRLASVFEVFETLQAALDSFKE
jgi:anti-anti-sigma factor